MDEENSPRLWEVHVHTNGIQLHGPRIIVVQEMIMYGSISEWIRHVKESLL